jgi:hypothetical protein
VSSYDSRSSTGPGELFHPHLIACVVSSGHLRTSRGSVARERLYSSPSIHSCTHAFSRRCLGYQVKQEEKPPPAEELPAAPPAAPAAAPAAPAAVAKKPGLPAALILDQDTMSQLKELLITASPPASPSVADVEAHKAPLITIYGRSVPNPRFYSPGAMQGAPEHRLAGFLPPRFNGLLTDF